MKFFKKTLLIAIGYYTLIIIQSCFICKCDKQKFRSYSFESLSSRNAIVEILTDSTYQSSIALPDKDTFNALEYGVFVEFKIVKFAQAKNKQHWSLVQSAIACSCNEFYINPLEKVTSLKIETIYDFDANNASGADVTDLFVFLERTYTPTGIIKKPMSVVSSIQDNYPLYESATTLSFMPYLDAAPQTARLVQFKITATCSNNIQFTALTRPVFLK